MHPDIPQPTHTEQNLKNLKQKTQREHKSKGLLYKINSIVSSNLFTHQKYCRISRHFLIKCRVQCVSHSDLCIIMSFPKIVS